MGFVVALLCRSSRSRSGTGRVKAPDHSAFLFTGTRNWGPGSAGQTRVFALSLLLQALTETRPKVSSVATARGVSSTAGSSLF